MVNIRKSPYLYYQSSNPLLHDHANHLNVFEGKPKPNVIAYWEENGMNVSQRKKWYIPPHLHSRIRDIQRKYKINVCHVCSRFSDYKLTFKMDGAALVEYYCSDHLPEEHKQQIPT